MSEGQRFSRWTLAVCGLLLLATMLNYMDRQTLSLVNVHLTLKLGFTDVEYGYVEMAFSLAFALGSLIMGFIADRVSIRWMYPTVLVGWSAAGLATGYAVEIGAALRTVYDSSQSDLFVGLSTCRAVLGFFEAGQWPCALITTRRLLASKERPLGNSILQSGASIGAILTPFVVQFSMGEQPSTDSWRIPFVLIGWIGMVWIVPWLLIVRGRDLEYQAESVSTSDSPEPVSGASFRRVAALMVMVVAINLNWQIFRAWLPRFLQVEHKYESTFANGFIVAYYIMTDIGCLGSGLLSRWMMAKGVTVHRSRLIAFSICAALTALALPMPWMDPSPLLLAMLLLMAAGSLGLFPQYYSFTQELSSKHQGKITGFLGAFTWGATAGVQALVGIRVKADGSYMFPLLLAGSVPMIAAIVIAVLWNEQPEPASSDAIQESRR